MIDLAIIAGEDQAPNTAPVITSLGGGPTASISVQENTFAIAEMTAFDAEDDNVTFTIVGGADADKFLIDFGNQLSFVSEPDFEDPQDADLDNVYEVIVEASDGIATDTQAISVTVTDQADEIAPAFTSAEHVFVLDGDPLSHTLVADESVTFTITGGADASLFEINGADELRFLANASHAHASPADANGDNVYLVQVTATDGGGNIATQTVRVGVTNSDGWIAVADYTMTHNVGSWNDVNLRERFSIDWPIGGGSEVRVTFISGTSTGATILAAGIGTAASGADFNGNQVALTFDTGSAGFTVAANTQKVSDAVAFSFERTDDLIVSMWHDDVNSWLQGAQGSQSTGNRHFADGRSNSSDVTLVTSPSGFGSGTANQTWGIKKIEIKA